MRVTIIKDDGVLGVDSIFKKVDLSTLDPTIRAVQWNGVNGHIEYYNDTTPNSSITSFLTFQSFLDEYNVPTPIPQAPAPEVISMRQARQALYQSSLLDQVNTFIAAIPGADGDKARIAWEYAGNVEKTNPLVIQIAAALPLTDQQVTDLFALGATL